MKVLEPRKDLIWFMSAEGPRRGYCGSPEIRGTWPRRELRKGEERAGF